MVVQMCESYAAMNTKCESNQSVTYRSAGDMMAVHAEENVVEYTEIII